MAKTTTRKPYEYTTPEAPVMQEYIDPKLFGGFGADDAGKVLGVNEKGEWCCREGGGNDPGGGSAELPELLQCSIEEKSFPETTLYHSESMSQVTLYPEDEGFFQIIPGREYKFILNGQEQTIEADSNYVSVYGTSYNSVSISSYDDYINMSYMPGSESDPWECSFTVIGMPWTETVVDPIDPRIVTMYEVGVDYNYNDEFTLREDITPLLDMGVTNIRITTGGTYYYLMYADQYRAIFANVLDGEIDSLEGSRGSTQYRRSRYTLSLVEKTWPDVEGDSSENAVIYPWSTANADAIRLRKEQADGSYAYYDITVDDAGELKVTSVRKPNPYE